MAKGVRTKPGLIQTAVVVLFVCIIVYFTLRMVLISFAAYGLLDKLLGFCFFLAEAYVMFHAVGYFGGIYRLHRAKTEEPEKVDLVEFPPVVILIPARHEPKEVLEGTIVSCTNLSYPCKTVYVLDDSTDQKYKAEARELALKHGCQLFRRQARHGAKAGIVNDCLKGITDKYIAIFDVDQNPIRGFLTRMVSILEADPRLAFIQTPQYYSNLQTSRVAFAANMQQAVFYENVCEAKSASQAMICCGTNVVFRREALDDVGGLDESTVTEDFATSLQFHLKGWKTLYYNHVNTFGQGPEDLGAYLSQQSRWAMGNVAVLKKVVRQIVRSPLSLRLAQWWEYVVTGSYYMVGWSYLFLIFCPILYIFFGIPSFFMNPVVYFFSFTPYLLLSWFIFYASMGRRGYKFKYAYMGQLLFFVSLPAYTSGSLLGLIGAKRPFKVTAKQGARRVSYIQLWPQLSLWVVNLAAVTWGINRFVYELAPAVAVNVIWTIYHFGLCSAVFYFNGDR